jgi:anti-sigma B factor antagonist
MMDIEARDVNDIKVVDIEGRLNTSTSPEADAFFKKLISDGVTKILINLEELDYTSSTGLRVILFTGKQLSKVKGKMAICSLNPTVKEVFDMAGFSAMFDVYETEEEALKHF